MQRAIADIGIRESARDLRKTPIGESAGTPSSLIERLLTEHCHKVER
jgi:hypothetical protein